MMFGACLWRYLLVMRKSDMLLVGYERVSKSGEYDNITRRRWMSSRGNNAKISSDRDGEEDQQWNDSPLEIDGTSFP